MIRLQELTSNILICEAIKSLKIIFFHMTIFLTIPHFTMFLTFPTLATVFSFEIQIIISIAM